MNLTKFIRTPYYSVKRAKQRMNRGFSDRDMWSADMYLAGLIADVLQWYIDYGHGVPMSYSYDLDSNNPDVDIMVERRNADYEKHIAILREYAKNGCALNQKWVDEFGGVLDKDIQKTLKWFSKHFTELWD